MNSAIYDIIVIGGGINGAGIAADAAGRNLSVYLCEQDDFAAATSSASSKLIHGGLRYLEHGQFRLVHEALKEREVLLGNASHLIKPLRFTLPHRPHLRPSWMIRLGLFLYDRLGKRETLAPSRRVLFDEHSPLKASIRQGFEYADCTVDDARLVICNLLAAKERGASLHKQTRCIQAKQVHGLWRCIMQETDSGRRHEVSAKALVNAAGPWVADFIKQQAQSHSPYAIRLIKGSHIVVPRLYDQEHAFILQNADKRVVFVIPYLDHFSLIGTTDVEYTGKPGRVTISAAETKYLLAVSNDYFKQQRTAEDIVWRFSGIRPLCDDESDNPAAITRDYTLTLDESAGAPLLSVFGGKITTYRRLAETALAKLRPYFSHMTNSWTRSTPLPGGDFPQGKAHFRQRLGEDFPYLADSLLRRYVDAYGTRCRLFLEDVNAIQDMGQHFGHQLYAAEVDYLVKYEWVNNVDDLLWRRSKLGLFMNAKQTQALQVYLTEQQKKQPS